MAKQAKTETTEFRGSPRSSGPAGQALRGSGQAGAEVLTSRDNRWLKEFRVALRGGVPTADGAVGVEGVRLVEEALGSGCRVEAVLFSESGERHRERLAPLIAKPEMVFPVLRTTDRLFEGIADTEHPQGVAALVVPRKFTLEEILAGARYERQPQDPPSKAEGGAPTVGMTGSPLAQRGENRRSEDRPLQIEEALIVVLAGVQDPGNVGTILRTAAAFGATGAVTAATGQSGTASPFTPKALRASAGAGLHLPIVSGMALGILLTQLKLNGIRTLASCAHEYPPFARLPDGQAKGAKDGPPAETVAPWEVDWCQPIALLVGNEGAGLPEELVHAADARIHIPMATLGRSGQAQVESLNAAAAAAVVLYEAYRQRRGVEK